MEQNWEPRNKPRDIWTFKKKERKRERKREKREKEREKERN